MMRQIAIVDDSQINRTLFRLLVAKLDDCESHVFEDPTAGLEWCLRQEPDLVIVDYMMPGLDGISFIERFRAAPGRSDIPVLMISASGEKEIRHRALERGATDFLNKPVDGTEFLARVRNMLALRMSTRKLADRAVWLTEEIERATRAIRQREQELVFRLSRAAEFRDPETGAHIQRMAHYSTLIAQHRGWSSADQQLLLGAAPMHDIGKIAISDDILLKPGRLTPDEFEIMKSHTVLGHTLLQNSDTPVITLGAEIALTHHEKYDGSGYPRQLRGDAIPECGRIVAVADVFDALTSVRPYKRAWSLDDARKYLIDLSGSSFDPGCVESFLAVWSHVLEISARFQDENPGKD